MFASSAKTFISISKSIMIFSCRSSYLNRKTNNTIQKMSQIPIENDDNRSVAASDVVQVDQADELPDQEAQQLNLMIANLKTKKQTLQREALKAELMNELNDQFANMLSAQSEQHKQEMEQLRDEFSKKFAEQQQLMMAQFQAQFHSLDQKLKEAEQQTLMGKNNEFAEIIQKMDQLQKEMDGMGQQASRSNMKLDYMWSQLMGKNKILANPKGVVWDASKSEAVSISECGLKVKATDFGWAFATEGFAISGEQCRNENFQFLGTNVFYYEVTITWNHDWCSLGFTDGSKPPTVRIGGSPNSYGIKGHVANSLWLSGKKHKLEYPTGVIADGDVFGCGLLLNSKSELAIFFTRNGILLGEQIRIKPTVDRLYPTVSFSVFGASVEANFGNNLVAKPFKFDTDKCPGLVFE